MRINDSHQTNAFSSTCHLNSGNGGNNNGDDCDDNGNFIIGDDNDNVSNDVDANYGDYGFEECVPFYPQQEITIFIHHIYPQYVKSQYF